eukprot:jgi/Galph1/3692/GphlegSOOS_G2362.1
MFFRTGLGSPSPIDLFLDRVEREKILEKIEHPSRYGSEAEEQTIVGAEGNSPSEKDVQDVSQSETQPLTQEETTREHSEKDETMQNEEEPQERALKLATRLLSELLDEDDLLVELRASNKRLLNFFSRPLIVKVLLILFQRHLLIVYEKALMCYVSDTVPPTDEDQVDVAKLKFKFPVIASEVLCSENVKIRESLALNTENLSCLFQFLQKPTGAIDVSSTGNFARVILTFLRLYPDILKDFVQQNWWILDSLIHHLYCMSLADILLRLFLNISYDSNKSSFSMGAYDTSSLQAIPGYNILDKLGQSFSPSSFPELDDFNRNEAISNSASVMVGIIQQSVSLSDYMEVAEEVDIITRAYIIGNVLDDGIVEAEDHCHDFDNIWSCPSLMNALRVCCELLISLNSLKGDSSSSERSVQRHSVAVSSLESSSFSNNESCVRNSIAAVELELNPRLPKLASFLRGRPAATGENTSDRKILGTLRLKVAEFFLTCLVTCCQLRNSINLAKPNQYGQDVVDNIFQLEVPQMLLKIFVECDMCNILHNYIVSVLSSCFCGESKGIQKLWITKCHIFDWLVQAWSENNIVEDFKYRKGYMGHLTQIGNILSQYLDENFDFVKQLISEKEIDNFENLRKTSLTQTNDLQSKPLGGSHPNQMLTSSSIPVASSNVVSLPGYEQLIGDMTSQDAEAVKQFAEYLYEQTNVSMPSSISASKLTVSIIKGEIDPENDDNDDDLIENSLDEDIDDIDGAVSDRVFDQQRFGRFSDKFLCDEEGTTDTTCSLNGNQGGREEDFDLSFAGDAIFASARDFPSEQDLEQLRNALSQQHLANADTECSEAEEVEGGNDTEISKADLRDVTNN